jgi:hypothetical protein
MQKIFESEKIIKSVKITFSFLVDINLDKLITSLRNVLDLSF